MLGVFFEEKKNARTGLMRAPFVKVLSLTGPLAPDATLLSYSDYIVPRKCGCQEA